ncbi:hypothetical protein DPSP01_002018 [Paraphaeosphaeria sporulosa]|uniref:Uncharacterized protein n=1 Tax=Paraphaeosphaeria sporulosa TaxID=1460663 RepID=A0A177D040_9PLEO|nr:uncharacterized protein CC84DRAFT_1226919 [Paraphaeosphaeria sporulosa]OAG12532.1 hypothetical protein CC84DRAFT_1226919 [Paraphaeosphaeria sporulosa]
MNTGTPLQKKLSKLALLLFGIAYVCALIVEAANKFSGKNEVVIYDLATGLSMIPASLIVVLTITMAVGTKHMSTRNVIFRKLDSLEALGAVTNICSDKTGTLTQGIARGDPTEISIQVIASRFGWNRHGLVGSNDDSDSGAWHCLPEYPFNSDTKHISVLYGRRNSDREKYDSRWVITKGALERVLPLCDFIQDEQGNPRPITDAV